MKLLAALAVALVLPHAAVADPARAGYPTSIAAIGDSITRAYNADLRPFHDGPAYSWSTGTNGVVQSAYLRILRASPGIAGQRTNSARDGAEMRDFVAQARAAITARADFVTVMLGSNDVCGASEASMPSVERFRTAVEAGMRALTAGLPEARVQLVSIPDVVRLWELERGSPVARTVWRLGHICQSLLRNPDSAAAADVERRARVRVRTIAFNGALATVCAEYVHCRFDGGAVFGNVFTRRDVSTRDFFHPSRTGQAKLADIVWRRTFDFRDAVPPQSLADVAPSAAGNSIALAAIDDVGVAGIEYRIDGSPWTAYRSPVLERAGIFEYRAVDVNGNVEASHTLVSGG